MWGVLVVCVCDWCWLVFVVGNIIGYRFMGCLGGIILC